MAARRRPSRRYAEARTRRETAAAHLAELELARTRGELIPAAQVIGGLASSDRPGAMLAVVVCRPPRLASLCLWLARGEGAVRERLADLVHAALAELADPTRPRRGGRGRGPAVEEGGVGPAATGGTGQWAAEPTVPTRSRSAEALLAAACASLAAVDRGGGAARAGRGPLAGRRAPWAGPRGPRAPRRGCSASSAATFSRHGQRQGAAPPGRDHGTTRRAAGPMTAAAARPSRAPTAACSCTSCSRSTRTRRPRRGGSTPSLSGRGLQRLAVATANSGRHTARRTQARGRPMRFADLLRARQGRQGRARPRPATSGKRSSAPSRRRRRRASGSTGSPPSGRGR